MHPPSCPNLLSIPSTSSTHSSNPSTSTTTTSTSTSTTTTTPSPSNSPRTRKLSEKAKNFFSSKKDNISNHSPDKSVSCDSISPPLNHLSTSSDTPLDKDGKDHKVMAQVGQQMEESGLNYKPRFNNGQVQLATSPTFPSLGSNGLGLVTNQYGTDGQTDQFDSLGGGLKQDDGKGIENRQKELMEHDDEEQLHQRSESIIKVSSKPNPAVEERLKALLSSDSRALSRLDSSLVNQPQDEPLTPTLDGLSSLSTPKARDFALNPDQSIIQHSINSKDHHHHHHLPSISSTQSKLRNLVHARVSSTSSTSNEVTTSAGNSKSKEPITIISTGKGQLLPLYGALPVVPSTSPISSNAAKNLGLLDSASSSREKLGIGKDKMGLDLDLDEEEELEMEKSNHDSGSAVDEAREEEAEEIVRESQLLGFSSSNSKNGRARNGNGFFGFRTRDQDQEESRDQVGNPKEEVDRKVNPNRNSVNFHTQDVDVPISDHQDDEEEDLPKPFTQQRPSIKVRIVTWNMASTVPKGDLEVLLGNVGEYIPPVKDWDVGYDSDDGEKDEKEENESEIKGTGEDDDDQTSSIKESTKEESETKSTSPSSKKVGSKSTLKGSAVIGQEKIPRSERIPPLPHNDSHPYHVIVIAGQECPWGDGKRIATGMGMAGEISDIALNRSKSNAVKLREKELKEKEKEKGGLKRGISSGNLKNGILSPALGLSNGSSTSDVKSPMISSSQATPWVNEFPFGSPPPPPQSQQQISSSQTTPSTTGSTPTASQNQTGQVATLENSEEPVEKLNVNINVSSPAVPVAAGGGWGLNMNVSGKGWSDMCEDWLCNGSNHPNSGHQKSNHQSSTKPEKPNGVSRNSSVVTTSTNGGKENEQSSGQQQPPINFNHQLLKSNSNLPSRDGSNDISRAQSPNPTDEREREKNKIDLPKLKLRLEGLQVGKKKEKVSTPSIEPPSIDLVPVPDKSEALLGSSQSGSSDALSTKQRFSSSSEGSQASNQQTETSKNLLSVPSTPIHLNNMTKSSSHNSQSSGDFSNPINHLPPLSPGAISPLTENPLDNLRLLPHAHHHHLNLNPINSSDKEKIPNEWGRIRSPNPSPSLFPSSQSNANPNQDHDATPQTLGPYELVTKERMLGCYTAVYVWRGCRDRVRGVSKNHVKSGLLSGRVGNKGGVGISLLLGRTRLLFVNAHLAAHEGRVATRLANVVKIKSELDVDTFLPANDPRNNYEDITEKFDHCFWCGDLNFRVDISRKHADWLLMQKAYQQALEFDQLRAVLKDGIVFKGFQEAPINFPPTYKYDVLKTLKIKRTRTVTQRIIHRRNGSSSKASSAFTNPSQDKIPNSQVLSSSAESKVNRIGDKAKKREKGSGKSARGNDTSASMTDEESDSSAWDPFSNPAFGEHREGDSDSDEDSGPASIGGKRDSQGSRGNGQRSEDDNLGREDDKADDGEAVADSILSSNTAAAQGPKVFSQGAAIKAKFKFLDLMRSVGGKDSDSSSTHSSSPIKNKKLPYVVRKDSGKESILSSDSSNPRASSPSSPIDIPNAEGMQTFACLKEIDDSGIPASHSDNVLLDSRSARSSISEDQEITSPSTSSIPNQRSSLPPPPKTYSGAGVKKRSTIQRPSSSDGLSLISSRQSGGQPKMDRNNSKSSAATGKSGSLADERSPIDESQAYDTSAKQRVPSWTDRVLWRSTVPIEEDEDANPQEGDQDEGFGSKVSRGISNALMIPQIRQATQRREAARQAAVTFALPASVAEREKEKERLKEKEKLDAAAAQVKSSEERQARGLEEFGASKHSSSQFLDSKTSIGQLPSRLSIPTSPISPLQDHHASPLRRFFRRKGEARASPLNQQKKQSKSKSSASSDWESNGLANLSRRGAVSAVDLPSQTRLEEKREMKELSSNFVVPPRRESLQLPSTQKERDALAKELGQSPLSTQSPVLRTGTPKQDVDCGPSGRRRSMFRSLSSSGVIPTSSPENSNLDLRLNSDPNGISRDSTSKGGQEPNGEVSPLTSLNGLPNQPSTTADQERVPSQEDSKNLSVNGTSSRRASSWWSDRVVMRLPSILTPAKAAAAFASLGIFGDNRDQEEKAVEPVLLGPKRGVIECLLYKTLDDREMRALEGRSDHRPVIFVACVGI